MTLIFEKNNWKQFTIRMHKTDSTAFDLYYEMFWKPFLQEFDHYLSVIEYPNTCEKHLHAVLGTTKGMKSHNTDKILNKIKRKQFHKLNLLNTDPQHALVVKDMNDPTTLYSGIGYLLKSEKPTVITNLTKKTLDAATEAYYHFSKKPHHTLENVLEYKNVPKGDVLAYLYDHYKKYPELPNATRYAHMVSEHKLSFGQHSDNMLQKLMLEFLLMTKQIKASDTDYTSKDSNYRMIKLDRPYHDMMNQPKYVLINTIIQLQEKIHDLEKR